jgi:hypothetical protein
MHFYRCRFCKHVDENEDNYWTDITNAKCSKYGDEIENIDEHVCDSWVIDPLLEDEV